MWRITLSLAFALLIATVPLESQISVFRQGNSPCPKLPETPLLLASGEILKVDSPTGTFRIGAVTFLTSGDTTYTDLLRYFRSQALGFNTTMNLHLTVLEFGQSLGMGGLTLTGRIAEEDSQYMLFEYFVGGEKRKILFTTKEHCLLQGIYRVQQKSKQLNTDLKLIFSAPRGT